MTGSGSLVASRSLGSGRAGQVEIRAEQITVSDRSEISAETQATGNAGRVIFEADELTVTEMALVNSRSWEKATGNAGQIVMDVGELNLSLGSEVTTESAAADGGDAGQVIIRADRFEMTGRGSRIRSNTRGKGNAGLIEIDTELMQVSGGRIQGSAFGGSTGDAGDVVITADTLIVEMGGRIASILGGPGVGGRIDLNVHDLIVRSGGEVRVSVDSDLREPGFESGDAGRLTVQASGRVRVTGEGSAIASRTIGEGNAGQIEIQAGQVTVSDHGEISTETEASGNAGNITIKANEMTVTETSLVNSRGSEEATGNAGQILLDVSELNLSLAGEITTETSAADGGDAGQVIIRADRIEMDGRGTRIRSITRGGGNAGLVRIDTGLLQVSGGRIQGSAFGGSTGDAGDVVITADTLIVEMGGRIASILGGPGVGGRIDLNVHDLIVRSGGEVRVSVDSDLREPGFESGDAGRLTVQASGRVRVTGEGSAIASRTIGEGNAGQIEIQAGQVTVSDHGEINTETQTSGNGGNITIDANEVRLSNQGVINTSSTSQSDDAGAGGNISVIAQRTVRLQDSEITTSVIGGEKSGGNIEVRAPVGLLERSNIRADAFGGPGGNISIQTQGLIVDSMSAVTASSALNVDGTVTVDGLIDISGALKPITQQFAQAEGLLRSRCAQRLRPQQPSRFLVRSRDRVPLDPSGPLPNSFVKMTDTSVALPSWREAILSSESNAYSALALNAWQQDCFR